MHSTCDSRTEAVFKKITILLKFLDDEESFFLKMTSLFGHDCSEGVTYKVCGDVVKEYISRFVVPIKGMCKSMLEKESKSSFDRINFEFKRLNDTCLMYLCDIVTQVEKKFGFGIDSLDGLTPKFMELYEHNTKHLVEKTFLQSIENVEMSKSFLGLFIFDFGAKKCVLDQDQAFSTTSLAGVLAILKHFLECKEVFQNYVNSNDFDVRSIFSWINAAVISEPRLDLSCSMCIQDSSYIHLKKCSPFK